MDARFLFAAMLFGLTLASCSLVDSRSDMDENGDDAEDLEEIVEITLLAAYTSDAATIEPDIVERIQNAVDGINDIYRQSALDVSLDVVHLVEVDYGATDRLQDLSRLINPDDGHLDHLHALRDEYEADIVVLVSDHPRATINGAIMASEETAFVMVFYNDLGAPRYGLAHEIGHLHGARHSLDDDPADEPFPYGHGFKTDTYRTIMANGRQQRVPMFSSPSSSYNGVAMGDSTSADVVRVIQETAAYISNFRGAQTPTDFVPPGHWPTVE